MGIKRGAWLEEAGREFIGQQDFEHQQPPIAIAHKLQNAKYVCYQMTNSRLKEKISTFLQGCRRKRYAHGINMTYQKFCSILEAWPTSSQLQNEVSLNCE